VLRLQCREAAVAFTGEDPEFLNNPLYQDQQSNME
jgi:hypothetical protein